MNGMAFFYASYTAYQSLAELTEHCPVVVFYWTLVFVNVSGLLHC